MPLNRFDACASTGCGMCLDKPRTDAAEATPYFEDRRCETIPITAYVALEQGAALHRIGRLLAAAKTVA
jgi:hypothetical protein